MDKKPRLGLKWILFVMMLSPAFLNQAAAQDPGKGGAMATIEPRNAVSVILMSGLVGGVLGLSTLSFYERPQDNIRNITIGAGVGMISAALFMTYSVSQAPPPVGHFQWAPAVGPEQVALLGTLKF